MVAGGLPALPGACASLRRAARAVTQLYDGAFRATGLHATQFTLLQVVSRRPDVMQGELGELLAVDSTTLSRTLRPLVSRGLLHVAPGQDGRTRLISLTAKGKTQLDKGRPAWEAVQEKLRGKLGGTAWTRLLEELKDVAEAATAA